MGLRLKNQELLCVKTVKLRSLRCTFSTDSKESKSNTYGRNKLIREHNKDYYVQVIIGA